MDSFVFYVRILGRVRTLWENEKVVANRIPLDPRSTYRKRLRKVLLTCGVPYVCVKCGRSNKNDGDKVDGIRVTVPEDARVFPALGSLQANHKNKVLEDCDEANGEWLCPSCHKEEDSKTAKGVSKEGDEYGYGFDFPVV